MKRRWFILGTTTGGLLIAAAALLRRAKAQSVKSDVAVTTAVCTARGKVKWIVLATVLVLAVASATGMLGFLYAGIYDIAAVHPHAEVSRVLLLTLKRNAVEFHARELDVPDLSEARLIRRGFVLYRENCVICHGAPGEARSRIGVGLNPNPPPLEKAAEEWTAAEIAWITANGLKMAGMPGFALGEQPGDLWALTAFVLRMNTLSPAEYRAMRAAQVGQIPDHQAPWLPPADQGWAALDARGDPARGRVLIRALGCGTCHRVPGVVGANGAAGPPLTNWAKRHYIAGTLTNTPHNLVPWIMNPQQIEYGTLMPNLGVREGDAWDMAAYLYSLGGEGGGE